MLLLAVNPLPGMDKEIFPAVVQGWSLAPDAEVYTPENLYEYIDGASELYISYGFEKLIARRYLRPGQPEITVDFFDMGTPGNAFGIFAHSQEAPLAEIGQDSEYLDGLLRFWQGRFYVSVLCSPETPESRAAVMALGRLLAGTLPPAAERPAILSLLPPAELLAASVRYFRHHAWQNTYVFISADNVLEIDPGTEAVLARYHQEDMRPVVLLVHYPDLAASARAFARLKRKFRLPDDRGTAIQLPDSKYFAAVLENRVVAAVWHGGSGEAALEMLAAMRARMIDFKDSK